MAVQGFYHDDSFRWASGSTLIAGAFVFWAVLLGADSPELAPTLFGAVAISLVMSVWLSYVGAYRQQYLFKIHRIHELERHLGFKANIRTDATYPGKIRYRLVGITGKYLDLSLYLVTCSLGP